MDLYEGLKGNRYFEYFSIKTMHDREGLSREELLLEYEKERKVMEGYMHPYENQFMSINSFEDKYFTMFMKGDHITLQEKIDGSNTHLCVSEDGFECWGNNFKLNEVNNLQGYWYWCKEHYKQVPSKYHGLSIYGEWLVPHHCEYPLDRYGDFYVFDVMENGTYWTQDKVQELATECGFQYAPVLYDGEFISWKHIMSYLGQTKLGGSKGEGVVLKNQFTLNETNKLFYVKIVDVEFQETNARKIIKTVNMNRVLELEEQRDLSESIVTLPRVRKAIFKLIEDGLLSESWQKLDTNSILKVVKPYVYRDCLKEEKEVVDRVGKIFGKYCNDLTKEYIMQLKE